MPAIDVGFGYNKEDYVGKRFHELESTRKLGIQILFPADGSSLPPGNIAMTVEVNIFIVSREGMGVVNRTGEGHMIYYKDEVPPVDAGKPATTPTSVISSSSDHLWRNVKEGKHTFSVQLVNNDDTPLDTPVVIVSTIEVKP